MMIHVKGTHFVSAEYVVNNCIRKLYDSEFEYETLYARRRHLIDIICNNFEITDGCGKPYDSLRLDMHISSVAHIITKPMLEEILNTVEQHIITSVDITDVIPKLVERCKRADERSPAIHHLTGDSDKYDKTMREDVVKMFLKTSLDLNGYDEYEYTRFINLLQTVSQNNQGGTH